MTFKTALLLLVSVLFLNGCATLMDTGSLFSHATDRSNNLIYLLEEDGLYQLADTLAEKEEKLSDACYATNDIIIKHLEDPDRWRTFWSWFLGEADTIQCQNSIYDIAHLIDRIIADHPKYQRFAIILPEYYNENDF